MIRLSSLLLIVALSTSVNSLINVTQISRDGCYNFTVGNSEKKEFYSPNYPNAYLPNIVCIRRIEADPGHFVKLDFQGPFRLESSARCYYDKLEVRDGADGNSPLLGTFCGDKVPNTLVSSGRYMWLKFQSDPIGGDTGFNAIYRFLEMPNQVSGEE